MSYPATYRDAAGELAGTIENDGRTLRLSLEGGAVFEGSDFDGLEPTSLPAPARFRLASGALCSCTLATAMPVTVVIVGAERAASLEVLLVLGHARADGGIDDERLRLALVVGDARFTSHRDTGWFEDALAEIQGELPAGWFFRTCFSCAWSDYSPAGHGLFGCLACFRDNKVGYSAVRSKGDLFRIWNTMTETVQETYVCAEFQRRQPGAGYRG